VALALFCLVPTAGADAVLVSVASVIDGDTIEIHGRRVRLHGIDAPESAQTCLDGRGREWRCGQRAALALQQLIGRRTVTRYQRDIDRYGRFVGQCFAPMPGLLLRIAEIAKPLFGSRNLLLGEKSFARYRRARAPPSRGRAGPAPRASSVLRPALIREAAPLPLQDPRVPEPVEETGLADRHIPSPLSMLERNSFSTLVAATVRPFLAAE
jgi:hypothetical protein